MKRGRGKWVALGVLVLLAAGASSKRSSATMQRPTRNPRTGKPVVTPGTRQLADAELLELVTRHGFADVDTAIALAKHESRGYVDVVVNTLGMTSAELHAYWPPALAHKKIGQELSVGLWQINLLANGGYFGLTAEDWKHPEGNDRIAAAVAQLKDPDTNARIASTLSNGGTTWGPWGGKPKA